MSDSDSLGINKLELRGGMGIGTKPHDLTIWSHVRDKALCWVHFWLFLGSNVGPRCVIQGPLWWVRQTNEEGWVEV